MGVLGAFASLHAPPNSSRLILANAKPVSKLLAVSVHGSTQGVRWQKWSEAEIPARACVCEYTPAHPRAQFCNPRKLRSQFALSLRTVLTACVVLTAAVMRQARDQIQLKNNPIKISNNLLPGVRPPGPRSLTHSHTRTYRRIGLTLPQEVVP